jgi:pilus assembly protein Flp/PilA
MRILAPPLREVEAMRLLTRYLALGADERGTTAIEYALIGALISIVMITAATTIGSTLTSTFNSVSSAL